MHKFIRLKKSTYDKLVKDAKYGETMDSIVQRVLESKRYLGDDKTIG